jgi:hypothetical protein
MKKINSVYSKFPQVLSTSSPFREHFLQIQNGQFQSQTLANRKNLPHHKERNSLLQEAVRDFLAAHKLSLEKLRTEDNAVSQASFLTVREKFIKRSIVKLPKDQLNISKRWPKETWVVIDKSAALLLTPSRIPNDNEPVLRYFETKNLPPNLPNDIKTFVKFNGGGTLGIEAQASQPDEHKVIVLEYSFTPDQDAMWTFMVPVEFHGFYSLWADQDWWNSRRANIYLEASIAVSQYFPGTPIITPLIDIGDKNIDVSSLFDSLITLQNSTLLRKNDPVTITVTITLDASAVGDDSRAELNFNDGTANFIRPHDMVATTNP